MKTSQGLFKLADPNYREQSRYVTFATFGDAEVYLKYYQWLESPKNLERDPQSKLLDLWSTADTDGCGEPPEALMKLPNDREGGRFVPTPLARRVWDRLVELGWKVVL